MNDKIEGIKAKLLNVQENLKKNIEVYNTAHANITRLSVGVEVYQEVLKDLEAVEEVPTEGEIVVEA